MASQEPSLTERVQSSFKQLSSAATSLNTRSDQLSKSIMRLDSLIQKLSLGASVWVDFSKWVSDDGSAYKCEEVGYDKLGSRWGIAIRSRGGREAEDDFYEAWLFNDAPRAMRLKAVEKIPELFESLTKEVNSIFKNVDRQLKVLDDFTSAIDAIVAEQGKLPPPSLQQRIHMALVDSNHMFTADAVENSLVEEVDGDVVFVTPKAFSLSIKGPELTKVVGEVLGRQPKIKLIVGDPAAPNLISAIRAHK